jgi:exodeoxyribonuclease V alpha subunit
MHSAPYLHHKEAADFMPCEAGALLACGFAERIGMLGAQQGAAPQALQMLTFAAAEVCRALMDGQIYLTLDDLAVRTGAAPAVLRTTLLASSLVCQGRAADILLRPLVLDDAGRLYLARYYGYERRVAKAFKMLAASGRLTIISGGPGTGKTTTVVQHIIRLFDGTSGCAGTTVALAAPTGKAAQHLFATFIAQLHLLPEAAWIRLPEQGVTLHRLLGIGQSPTLPRPTLPDDIVVVDESTMIDIALAARLVDALASPTRLILLGDPDQLPAVEAGTIFAELSAPSAPTLFADCVIRLEHPHRFGRHSAIGQLSRAIRTAQPGEALALLTIQSADAFNDTLDEAEAIQIDDGANVLSEASMNILVAGFTPYVEALCRVLNTVHSGRTPDLVALFNALNAYRVLATVRAGPRGVNALNTALSGLITTSLSDLAAKNRLDNLNNSAGFAGRPVIVTRNDYALELFNGDMGIALPIANGALHVFFSTPLGELRAFPATVLPPHQTAFALTVHQSQGAEFEQVALVLPVDKNALLTRELIYTAVTRARKKVKIFGAPSLLAQAINTPAMRPSGLTTHLLEPESA